MNMPERYKKLPGHLRGIFRGASLWMGSDHMLAVRSQRFREEYKRFYFRDVQSIAVAESPRFHISSRAFAIAIVWVFAYLIAWRLPLGIRIGLWSAAVVLVAAWIYISAACSCRCRIYTAVSGDELPSIYRTWIARRFLAKLDPRIAQVQGVIEGNWAEAAEEHTVGPAYALPGQPSAATSDRGRTRTPASDIFLAILFADALITVLTLHSPVSSIPIAFTLLKMGGAMAVLVQRYQGILKPAMQRIAVATLAVMGAMYYGQAIVGGMAAGASGHPAAQAQQQALALGVGYPLLREISAAVSAILGFAGAGVILMKGD